MEILNLVLICIATVVAIAWIFLPLLLLSKLDKILKVNESALIQLQIIAHEQRKAGRTELPVTE